jgi:predicted TIM-barrel fold metal-dependent hydrolase
MGESLARGSGAVAAPEVGFRIFDADNHYYEARDAFTRHMDAALAHRGARWIKAEDGTDRLLFGDRLSRYLGSSPTFDHVARPGALLEGNGYGDLEPIPAEYRDRDARLRTMDAQGVESVLVFPTLAVSVEELLADDVEATYASLEAFNRWLEEDWGFAHEDRIYAVPMLSMLDPDRSAKALEQLLNRGARAVNMRPGPINGRSPAHPVYDKVWALLNEARVGVTYHAADGPYRQQMAKLWGWGNVNMPERHIPAQQKIIGGSNRAMHDTMVEMVYNGVFERFPNLRVASVELSGEWVNVLARSLTWAAKGDTGPFEVLRAHAFVSPFEHEDIGALADLIGENRILFGSDWPHTDGLAEPSAYVKALHGFSDEAIRLIMRDNVREFLGLN